MEAPKEYSTSEPGGAGGHKLATKQRHVVTPEIRFPLRYATIQLRTTTISTSTVAFQFSE